MATKAGIEALAEVGPYLPELVSRGFGARDRLTYYVSLLLAAQNHARAPHEPAPTLRAQREASGIPDQILDQTVAASRPIAADVTRIPGAGEILTHIFIDLHEMLQPLRAAAAARPDLAHRLEIYQKRLDLQIASMPPCDDDRLTSGAIDGLARRTRNGHDSVQQLAMDLQWELIGLNKMASPEVIDGATAYGLSGADQTIVRAFMRGVQQTRGLKGDRAGLATSALRDGDELSIHNDLERDADHVLVVHVHELTATVTYTDPHRARMRLFTDMLLTHDVHWDVPTASTEPASDKAVGHYLADSQERLEQFLEFVGSRLVFLVDWNRARKRLGRFVKNAEAVALLKWAADHNVGHHAFLRAGDARLVYTALERALPCQLRFGARLDELLGADAARAFLTSVLSIAATGVDAGRSAGVIEDEVEAALLSHLRSSDGGVLGAAVDHATVVSSIAEQLSHALTRVRQGEPRDEVNGVSDSVAGLEARADQIVRRSSRVLDPTGDGHRLRLLLTEADDAADVLEENAFLLTLLPAEIDAKSIGLLEGLADLMSRDARDYVRCVEDARDLAHSGARPSIERFLVMVDQLDSVRRQAVDAERAVRASLFSSPADCRELYVASAMARGFEQAAHSLARCAVIVRDYVLNTSSINKSA